MNYLKEKIESLISGKNKIENQWNGVADLPASLGLSMDGVASDFKEITHKEYPESKNAYLKVIRKTKEFKDQIQSYFSENKSFAKEIQAIAKEAGHSVEKLGNLGFRVSNSQGPFVDVDFSGNIVFRNGNVNNPAIEKYIDAVTNKFKSNDAYIVFKGGDNFTDSQNEELLKVIAKSMIRNDIDFKRLHVADEKFQGVIDEFTPSPTRVDLVNGKYIKSDKGYEYSEMNSQSVLAMRGMNCIKYAGGDLKQFEKFSKIYEIEHKMKISFSEKGDVVNFSSTDSENSISFRTASIKEGGRKLRDNFKSVLLQKEELEKSHNAHFVSLDFETKYDNQGQKSKLKSNGVKYA